MLEDFKCFLLSVGIGFALGAVITANNKKFQMQTKDAENFAMEKFEMAKEGIEKLKKNINKSQNSKSKQNTK